MLGNKEAKKGLILVILPAVVIQCPDKSNLRNCFLRLTVQGSSTSGCSSPGSKSLKLLITLHLQLGEREQWMPILISLSPFHTIQDPSPAIDATHKGQSFQPH